MNVSQIILAQLGGNRFLTMTGAKNLTTNGSNLAFRLPKNGKRKINHVRIELTDADLYTVTFLNINFRSFNVTIVETVEHVYADQLVELFESNTGYYTSL